jgi:HPt (histidine-containing phosphotransfer) domain-containing protein
MADQKTETLDRGVIASFREGDPDGAAGIVAMLIDQFLIEATAQTDRLREAGRQNQAATLTAAAHNLKGSALTMGARRLGSLCSAIEAGAAGRPCAAHAGVPMADLLTEVEQEMVHVRQALLAEREGASSYDS